MVDYRAPIAETARALLADPDVDLGDDRALFERLADPDVDRGADVEDYKRVLRRTHGDIEDAKAALVFILLEEDEDLEPEDVEFVTEEPPTATFT